VQAHVDAMLAPVVRHREAIALDRLAVDLDVDRTRGEPRGILHANDVGRAAAPVAHGVTGPIARNARRDLHVRAFDAHAEQIFDAGPV